MPQVEGLSEPWRSFFHDLDGSLSEPVELHCLGGFALVHAYGVARTTNDVDFISVIPHPLQAILIASGGKGSELHRRHKVYLDAVTVASFPADYESRLRPLFAGSWKAIQLYALEPHDLALAKLERNWERDREDVRTLATAGHLDPDVLTARYSQELRPYLTRETWHDQTLEMWLESCWPDRYAE